MKVGNPRKKSFNNFCRELNFLSVYMDQNFKFLNGLAGTALRSDGNISTGTISLAHAGWIIKIKNFKILNDRIMRPAPFGIFSYFYEHFDC